ncbi:MAG: hypothetical protein BMS9Abin12_0525 [Acidimicrobiia bacterium]|nr:MAG: hypothetical protein BMS9Abin12_0525 [Acidimicrobiia bacterium]
MDQSDEAWSDVVEQVKKLGSMFKYHYQAQESDEGAEAASKDDVKDALRTLGESISAAFATVGDAVKDPEVQEEARQTAVSFFTALGTTFSGLADDISKRREQEDLPAAPPSEDADRPDASEEEQ